MNICVVALGKIGLPLAVQFAAKGHKVIGADVNEKVVELVNAGTEPCSSAPRSLRTSQVARMSCAS